MAPICASSTWVTRTNCPSQAWTPPTGELITVRHQSDEREINQTLPTINLFHTDLQQRIGAKSSKKSPKDCILFGVLVHIVPKGVATSLPQGATVGKKSFLSPKDLIWSFRNPLWGVANDPTYRIKHIGLCLSLLIFCQTKSDSKHRITNHTNQLFFSDM